MNTILISYDLVHAPESDYINLAKHLKSYSSWAKPLESFWLVKTNEASSDVQNAVRQHVHADDKVIAIDVTGKAAAWCNLSSDLDNWIINNL